MTASDEAISRVTEALCRMPRTFRGSGLSMVQLIGDIGYSEFRDFIDEKRIRMCLKWNPDTVQDWLKYCEDQRCTPAWYLDPKGHEDRPSWPWLLGHVSENGKDTRVLYRSGYRATAALIKRYADNLLKIAQG